MHLQSASVQSQQRVDVLESIQSLPRKAPLSAKNNVTDVLTTAVRGVTDPTDTMVAKSYYRVNRGLHRVIACGTKSFRKLGQG